jgi:putative effector of murein hydrolase LrgA (UPF0299 family)
MSRLSGELSVAPRPGVVVSMVLALAALTAFVTVVTHVPLPGRIVLGLLMGLLVLGYGLLVSYVYGDARRRGMRHVLWTLVALFVPNALGLIAYFILREPLLQPCGACGATAKRDFAFCPQCGSPLPRVCPSCRRPVELAWTHCAHCGKKLLEGSSGPAPDESPFQEG